MLRINEEITDEERAAFKEGLQNVSKIDYFDKGENLLDFLGQPEDTYRPKTMKPVSSEDGQPLGIADSLGSVITAHLGTETNEERVLAMIENYHSDNLALESVNITAEDKNNTIMLLENYGIESDARNIEAMNYYEAVHRENTERLANTMNNINNAFSGSTTIAGALASILQQNVASKADSPTEQEKSNVIIETIKSLVNFVLGENSVASQEVLSELDKMQQNSQPPTPETQENTIAPTVTNSIKL